MATKFRLLAARPLGDEQLSRIGDQTRGRVFLFLSTDDFWRDYRGFVDKGVFFVMEPREELYGNQWDLIEHKERATALRSISLNL